MNIEEIKDLMAQFDHSSLKEFSYRNAGDELTFSKNTPVAAAPLGNIPVSAAPLAEGTAEEAAVLPAASETSETDSDLKPQAAADAEGELIESPLVGVAYMAPAPDKPPFISVGDRVKKGQTLLIIEAMKVMNEIPAPRDGVVTEILAVNEKVIEFGEGLVRIK
ncbi:acetyl-CoA carboxylase biotin carboxyl carrier protein [Streptococcus pantholopis]|uniref:Biotin carboxyl carrier protein of acetyl-CoA carboxylase n=1 Tax=Streptococcus pantholopis TaxID=1811193 RepID=A0A172Q8R4_9STRE|nr:acetyl-CoA carboxylase biotin carboxyl carrier protein [Streptococcus pantholopis]AND79864.1 acetyl-CoA carboxylase biotin carboxyl carrier protein subunit [Streptococcus pantholopis]